MKAAIRSGVIFAFKIRIEISDFEQHIRKTDYR